MTRVAPLRRFAASLLASMAFCCVVLVCLGWDVSQTPYVHADGSPDNTPARGLGVLIMISPLLIALLTAAMWISTTVLQLFKRLSPISLAAMVVMVSFCMAALLVLDRPFGWRDQLYYLTGSLAFLLAAFGMSAAVWWKVATSAPPCGSTDTPPYNDGSHQAH